MCCCLVVVRPTHLPITAAERQIWRGLSQVRNLFSDLHISAQSAIYVRMLSGGCAFFRGLFGGLFVSTTWLVIFFLLFWFGSFFFFGRNPVMWSTKHEVDARNGSIILPGYEVLWTWLMFQFGKFRSKIECITISGIWWKVCFYLRNGFCLTSSSFRDQILVGLVEILT